jgi:hypothetical protein
MPNRPHDRPTATRPAGGAADDPRVYVVIDGQRFPKPGLETVFVDTPADAQVLASGCACKPVAIPICACIKVSLSVPVCSCVGHPPCQCVGNTVGTTTTYGCRCAPVH